LSTLPIDVISRELFGCYSAFELEVEAVKGEMVTRLSNRLLGHQSAKD
jgi:hypothetical protein